MKKLLFMLMLIGGFSIAARAGNIQVQNNANCNVVVTIQEISLTCMPTGSTSVVHVAAGSTGSSSIVFNPTHCYWITVCWDVAGCTGTCVTYSSNGCCGVGVVGDLGGCVNCRPAQCIFDNTTGTVIVD